MKKAWQQITSPCSDLVKSFKPNLIITSESFQLRLLTRSLV